jgi:hypothetical protein
MSKFCADCKENKPNAEFSKNAQNKDGMAVYCRTCNARKQREWKLAHQEKVRLWRARYNAKLKNPPSLNERTQGADE